MIKEINKSKRMNKKGQILIYGILIIGALAILLGIISSATIFNGLSSIPVPIWLIIIGIVILMIIRSKK